MRQDKPHTLPPFVVNCFFALGIISAFAFRAIIVLERIEPSWMRPVWYLGVLGYLLFFLYRYRISSKRKRAIRDFGLIEKIGANACLTDDDREVVLYLLNSIRVSQEDKNYAAIFVLSVAAVAADLLLYLL